MRTFAWILWVALILWFLSLIIDLVIQIRRLRKTNELHLNISWGLLIDVPMFVFLSILIFGGML